MIVFTRIFINYFFSHFHCRSAAIYGEHYAIPLKFNALDGPDDDCHLHDTILLKVVEVDPMIVVKHRESRTLQSPFSLGTRRQAGPTHGPHLITEDEEKMIHENGTTAKRLYKGYSLTRAFEKLYRVAGKSYTFLIYHECQQKYFEIP